MDDVIVIVMSLAFFGLAVAYVALCNRIIGPDEADLTDTGDDTASGGDDTADRLVVEVDA